MKLRTLEQGRDFGGCFENRSETETIETATGASDPLVEEDRGSRLGGTREVPEKEIEEEGLRWRGER